VIDHSLSNPVETGFREVLQRQAPGTGAGAQQNAVANPLYRKPNFSGYYENYYTSSESLHQVQKNGVVDIKSSLNVVGGKAVLVGVGISGAYYDAQGSTDAAIKKKLYITANFLLPKVELSFDDSRPCASAEFEAACEKALSADTEKDRFTALVSILGKFGQFVPTQTLVGGRLFATDVKEFIGNESESDVASRYAGRLKVSAESVTASFDSDTSVERSQETNSRANDKDETRTQNHRKPWRSACANWEAPSITDLGIHGPRRTLEPCIRIRVRTGHAVGRQAGAEAGSGRRRQTDVLEHAAGNACGYGEDRVAQGVR
jgi:hypothetical protein